MRPAAVPGARARAPGYGRCRCLDAPALRAGAGRSHRFRRGECVPFWKAPAPFPAQEGHRFSAQNAPHIFFCLGKRKRAAPGTKENRFFIGLLVRPAKTGLVSSSCAEPLDLSVRSRRSCFIGCKPEGAKRTRGPSCAAAARSGNRSKFLPRRCKSALLLPAERQRRCCGKQSYLHQQVIESETTAAQASWARRTMSAAGNSQTNYCPMFS